MSQLPVRAAVTRSPAANPGGIPARGKEDDMSPQVKRSMQLSTLTKQIKDTVVRRRSYGPSLLAALIGDMCREATLVSLRCGVSGPNDAANRATITPTPYVDPYA